MREAHGMPMNEYYGLVTAPSAEQPAPATPAPTQDPMAQIFASLSQILLMPLTTLAQLAQPPTSGEARIPRRKRSLRGHYKPKHGTKLY